MSSDSVQVFRPTDLKHKDVAKLINRSDLLAEKKLLQNSNSADQKQCKNYKCTKKVQETKKSGETKIEDVFFNSEYFKHQSNQSSISFCSGDNGENRWTIDSKFEMPTRRKSIRGNSYSSDFIKKVSSAYLRKDREAASAHSLDKSKKESKPIPNYPLEKTEELLEGMLTDKGRIDRDLVTLITEQMFLAERELQITRTHLMDTISKLNERDLEIIRLQEKVQSLQKSDSSAGSKKCEKVHDSGSKSSDDYQRLVLASEKLKKQVKDMEDFLNDYGLVWVGDKDPVRKPDFDKVIKNFQKLNAIASQPKIIQTTMGAKFELPRQISLVLYSNGFLLRGDDFRDYGNVSANLFLQDVEDGYFPSELQNEFPEGVPFEVTDKRTEFYGKTSEIEAFKGSGNRLGSNFENKPPSMVFLQPVHDSKSHNFESVDKLLKKYQRKRSRSTYFQDDTSFSGVVANEVAAYDVKAVDQRERGRPMTVKIRFGSESFLLRVHENDRLARFQDGLHKKLCERFHDDCLVSGESGTGLRTDFELHLYGRTPFRLLDNLNKRVRDCGIVDNCKELPKRLSSAIPSVYLKNFLR